MESLKSKKFENFKDKEISSLTRTIGGYVGGGEPTAKFIATFTCESTWLGLDAEFKGKQDLSRD